MVGALERLPFFFFFFFFANPNSELVIEFKVHGIGVNSFTAHNKHGSKITLPICLVNYISGCNVQLLSVINGDKIGQTLL